MARQCDGLQTHTINSLLGAACRAMHIVWAGCIRSERASRQDAAVYGPHALCLTFHSNTGHRRSYVTVAPDVGRRLYYYLVGSESPTADDDPLVIWLTGGPGCSSLDAFTYENGPFIFELSTSAGAGQGGGAEGWTGRGCLTRQGAVWVGGRAASCMPALRQATPGPPAKSWHRDSQGQDFPMLLATPPEISCRRTGSRSKMANASGPPTRIADALRGRPHGPPAAMQAPPTTAARPLPRTCRCGATPTRGRARLMCYMLTHRPALACPTPSRHQRWACYHIAALAGLYHSMRGTWRGNFGLCNHH
jgi:hypothetical protein